jgi:hypothetical protein
VADAVAVNAAAATATPAQSQPAQTPVGEAALSKLPEKLQNLTRPVVVTGTVAGETPEGLTRVRTAAGEVLLKAPVPLPADKPVTLQIPAGSPPAKAMVLAQLPGPPTAGPVAPPPPQVNAQVNTAPLQTAVTTLLQQTAGAAATGPAQLPTVGALISAVVIAANPRPSGTAASATGGSGAATTTAPTGGGKGEATGGKAAAEGEATSATDGAAGKAAGAIRGGGASTHGQPVELGGDAAHRGTLLGPPPGAPTRKPDGQADPQQQQQQQTPGDNRKAGETNAGTGKTDSPQPGKPGAPPPASPAPAVAAGQSAQAPQGTQPPPPTGAKPQTAPQPGPQAAGQQQPPSTTTTSPGALIAARPAPPSVPSAQISAPATPAPPATQTTPQAPAQTPQQTPTSPPPLPAGQTLVFRVLAATPPPTSPPAAGAPGAPPQALQQTPQQTPLSQQLSPDNNDGAVMEGTVAGTTPQGKPILALRDGMLALNTDVKLPPGARLTLQLTDPAAIKAERPAPLDGALPDYLQGRDWSALKTVLAALRDIDPALVQHFLAAAMPQPNRKLGATLSFLISAMRGGDARGWLGGDATQALRERGKESLLLEVEREIRNTEKQTAEKLPDDWQGVTLPMYDQSGVNPMHIFIHPFPEPEQEDEKGKAAKGARFLLDVELSRLGPLQLDGMVKPPQFDLILRSKTPLAPELRADLRSIFADCLGAVGYAGGVTFQSDLRAWVRLARAGSAGPAVSA